MDGNPHPIAVFLALAVLVGLGTGILVAADWFVRRDK